MSAKTAPSSWLPRVTVGLFTGCVIVGAAVPASAATALPTHAPIATYKPAPTHLPVLPAGPQLSILVDDGVGSVQRGDRLTYTTTIKNIGATAVSGLRVTQTLPAGLALVSSSPRGTAGGGVIGWNVDLRAGRNATFTAVATMTGLPAGQVRLASVACAQVAGANRPAVCSADSDALKGGAASGASAAAAPSGGGVGWWLFGGIGGAAAVVLVATGWFTRRVRPRRHASMTTGMTIGRRRKVL